MPSGSKMRWRSWDSRSCPETASITWPSQSVLIPYSHFTPGSSTSGTLIAATLPSSGVGVPVRP